MASQAEIRAGIAERIVAALKAGTPPWRKPWSDLENTGAAANVVSRRPYSGVNPLLLDLTAAERGYRSRWWATFAQWRSFGLRVALRPIGVPPGQWGTKVVFCKPVARTAPNAKGDQEEQRFLLLRSFTVFNAEQVEGDGAGQFLARPRATTSFEDHAPAEHVIASTNARIEFAGSRAAYSPDDDLIRLPPKGAFECQHEFYATAFHELAHWSGHRSRLDRLVKHARFGSAAYSFEELVAEIGGCFLCTEVGVPQSTKLDNQAAYLASWLAVLQADPSAIFAAANQASAAADYILSFSRKENGAAGEADLCETAASGA